MRNINENYSVCRFQKGKVYNCDLNATYNIAAKFVLRGRGADQLEPGQSPSSKPRMPATLSLLWTAHAAKSRDNARYRDLILRSRISRWSIHEVLAIDLYWLRYGYNFGHRAVEIWFDCSPP